MGSSKQWQRRSSVKLSDWGLKNSLAGFWLAGFIFLITSWSVHSETQNGPPTAGQESRVPAKDFEYPGSYGLYAYDGAEAIPLAFNLGEENRILPVTTSLIVYQKGLEDPVKIAADVTVLDGRTLWERPPVWKGPPQKIDIEVKPIEGHPGMLLIVPKSPWKPGLYWLTFGDKRQPSYVFGIETPDEEKYWNEVLTENPNNWQAHNHLGAFLYMHGNVKGAYPHFVRAAQLNPTNPESHNNVALALCVFGKTKEAIKEYETAVKLQDDTTMDTNLANAYTTEKRYDDAERTYRHALELDPNNASAHCNLGYLLMQKGNLDEAIKEFRETVRLDPDLPQGEEDLKQALSLKAGKS
jgi:Flp pilus assembly protein TadD